MIPPNSYLSISNKVLKVTLRTKQSNSKYSPIDFFMTSLAKNEGKKAIDIVLSEIGRAHV